MIAGSSMNFAATPSPHGSRSLSLAQFDTHIRTIIDLGVWDKQISFYQIQFCQASPYVDKF
jgi:hypothetical protein